MSYNTPLASTTNFGVVEVGSNITVVAGVVSLPQSVATTANPTFATLTSTGAVTDTGNRVITTLTAGTNVTITGTAPSLTINASTTPIVATRLISSVDSPYTALGTDDYIGVLSLLAAPVSILLPAGIPGYSYTIKSEFGNTGAITITPNLLETIDGAATLVIPAIALGSATLVFRGTNWNVV